MKDNSEKFVVRTFVEDGSCSLVHSGYSHTKSVRASIKISTETSCSIICFLSVVRLEFKVSEHSLGKICGSVLSDTHGA